MILRRAQKRDVKFLFDLRNDEKMRQFAFNTEKVELETHQHWFERTLANENALLFIAEENGEKIGQIRFDFEPENNRAEVNVALISSFRGRGYGTELLRLGCQMAAEERDFREAVAHIKPNNTRSIKAFSLAGFSPRGEVIFKTDRCLEMIWSNSNS